MDGIHTPTSSVLSPVVDSFVGASGPDVAAALAGVVCSVARARGLEVEFRLNLRPVEPDPSVAEVVIDPDLARRHGHFVVGYVREALTNPVARRNAGVHHTPADLASAIVETALSDRGSDVVADPSVGGGVFLLVAAQQMSGTATEVLARLVGCDIDPLAVATTEAALAIWADGVRPPTRALRVADFMDGDGFGGVRPDVVVGNPPFLSQLRGSAVRDEARRAKLRRRWPEISGYIDDSVAFLLAAVDAAAEGGTVAFVQPTSILSARDARPVREKLDSVAPPTSFWWSRKSTFDAEVDTCAIVCRLGSDQGTVRRFTGLPFEEMEGCDRPSPQSWSPLLSGMTGVPQVSVRGETLSSIARVTAGFRDQYYGLREAVVDDPDGEYRLITSGLIDPLRSRWGTASCRFDRRPWQWPTVVIDRVDPGIRGWIDSRLRPKLLVSTQTRVIEAVVDPAGKMIPCTPVVVVEPHDPEAIWHVAAALTSPVVAAMMVDSAAGSGLSSDSIRVTASTLGQAILPPEGSAWDAAAEAARSTHRNHDQGKPGDLVAMARLCNAAYGVADDELLDWWSGRLPHRDENIAVDSTYFA